MTDIAINPVTRRVQATGNTGTGPFLFNFNILAETDIAVYKNNTLLTLTTDYTVTINANGTGSVTLEAAQAVVASDLVTILGGRELSRTTDFVTAGDLLASSLNEQLDSQVVMAQQLDEKISRTLQTNPGDADANLELPLKADRAGTILAFDSTTGNPIAGPNSSAIQSLFDDINAGLYVPATGGTFTGEIVVADNITVTGTVDGRDIAADGALLDTALQNVVDDASPELGGDLNTNAYQINVGNTPGSKLSISNDGSVSSIVSGGSTNFTIQAGNYIALSADGQTAAVLQGDADSTFYYNGNTRLTINSDGVDVDGQIEGTTLNITSNGAVGGNLTVTGNLQVDGTTTTVNSTTLDVADKNITVAKGAANAAAANGAGLTVDVGTNDPVIASPTILYDSITDRWDFNKDIEVANLFVSGNVDGVDVSSFKASYDLHNHDSDYLQLSGGVLTGNLRLDGTGDVTLHLNSDTDNSGENDNPTIQLTQDNQANFVYFGMNGDADSVFTGADPDSAYIATNRKFTIATGDTTDTISDVTPALSLNVNNSIIGYNSSGTEKLIWKGDQERLGIGTTSPSYALHVVGQIYSTGNVNGRDMTTDGTKLDGIEASADVTDATNVEAAGALMDSEVTNLDQVKAFSSADYATAAQGTTADSAMQDLVDDTSPQLGGTLNSNNHNIDLGDSTASTNRLRLGVSQDLQMFHNGTTSTLVNSTGDLGISNQADNSHIKLYEDDGSGATTPYIDLDGSTGEVLLNHYGSTKFATKSTGIDVTGNITVSGTVDGRDLATDGTKLDNIESGATADQTGAEIKTAYEGEADTNAFTDALLTKLNNIEANATADQSASEIKTAYESNADTNAFTDAEQTKLSGIEANATADQTKADIDALNIDADTLDGQHGSYYTGYTDTAISNLVDSAPGTLDTLNELAAALGDDANFSTTVTNSIATKLPLAGGTMTGAITFAAGQTFDGRDLSVDGTKLDGIEAGATADQTAAEILTALKTVDGSGSGLDADLLDGLTSNSFLRANAEDIKSSGNLIFNDDVLCKFGTGQDLSIYHYSVSGNSVISNATGRLDIINQANDNDIILQTDNGSGGLATYILCDGSAGVVKLYGGYGGLKLATSASGISVTGNITVSGNVDGRDVAADGTKLDGIEAGATADQTKADIDALGIDADTVDGAELAAITHSGDSVSLTGDVTGSTTVAADGSISISTTVTNDSHTHSFNNLTGKTSGTGDYSTSADIVSGRGSGGVALTINDGYGNANVTWNHQNGVPEQNGNAMRIEGNTDSTSGATLWFEGKSNVTGGSAVGLNNWFTMSDSGATCLGNTVWHAGNDGSGSGLDADLLDGQHGSYYATASHGHTGLSSNGWGGITSSTSSGYIDFGPANTSHAHIYTDRPNFYFNKQLLVNGSTVWNSGNDGSGSGLDADTVDGIQASSFLRSDATDTQTAGSIRFLDLTYFGDDASNSAEIIINTSNAGSPQIDFTESGDASWAIGVDDGDNSFKIHGNASASIPTINNLASPLFEVTTGGLTRLQQATISDASATLNLTSATNGSSIINMGDSADLDRGRIIYNQTSDAMYFITNASERLRIDSTGRVGIGTSSPAQKLDVAGNIAVTGTVDGKDVSTLTRVKRTEFDVTPNATSVSITTSQDSNVSKYVFVIADTNFSSGPNNPQIQIGRAATYASWTGGYAYTTGADGSLSGTDILAGLSYYHSPLDAHILEIWKTTDRWVMRFTASIGSSGTYIAHGYATNISRDYLSNILLSTGSSSNYTTVQGTLLEYVE